MPPRGRLRRRDACGCGAVTRAAPRTQRRSRRGRGPRSRSSRRLARRISCVVFRCGVGLRRTADEGVRGDTTARRSSGQDDADTTQENAPLHATGPAPGCRPHRNLLRCVPVQGQAAPQPGMRAAPQRGRGPAGGHDTGRPPRRRSPVRPRTRHGAAVAPRRSPARRRTTRTQRRRIGRCTPPGPRRAAARGEISCVVSRVRGRARGCAEAGARENRPVAAGGRGRSLPA